jgi:glycosyltransferase involved in cell wall biosynthesis
MEWIILDDGQESCKEILEEATKGLPNIRYISLDEKVNIGEKRNMLNKLAKGSILVAMDDDDFYSPERVSHVVEQFKKNPTIELAGSSELFIYYTDSKEIYKLGPYNKNHATNGTMAYRASYAATHTYDEMVTFAEEKSFLEQYTNPMIQLDPMKVMLVMSHEDNTFDKDTIRSKETSFVKKTTLTPTHFIKDEYVRKMFI